MKRIPEYFNKIVTLGQCILLCFVVASCVDNAPDREPETIIIPDGYIGAFYILFNVTDGVDARANGVGRIYEIPSTGVLFTQSSENLGWIDSGELRYFYRKADGALEPISERWTMSVPDNVESRSESIITIFGGGISVYNHPDRPCEVVYQTFYVGTKADILDGINPLNIEDMDLEDLKRVGCAEA